MKTTDTTPCAQFAGVAYFCKDVYPSGWPFTAAGLGKLTRTQYRERRAYARDAQAWHDSELFQLSNTRSRAVAARLFHGELSRAFPVRNLAAAARNFTPNFLDSFRARIIRMKCLRVDAASYVRAAYSYRIPFAPHPSAFLPQPSDWSGCVSAL